MNAEQIGRRLDQLQREGWIEHYDASGNVWAVQFGCGPFREYDTFGPYREFNDFEIAAALYAFEVGARLGMASGRVAGWQDCATTIRATLNRKEREQ